MSNNQSSKHLYLRLLKEIKPYWKIFLLSILSMVVAAATEPAMPALIKPMLDGSFVEKDPQAIRTIPILLVLIFLIRGLANFTSSVSVNWVSNKLVMNLRNAMFQKLLSMPNTYHDLHPSGKTLSKITYDATQVTAAATNVLIVLVKDSLAIIGLLGWVRLLMQSVRVSNLNRSSIPIGQ